MTDHHDAPAAPAANEQRHPGGPVVVGIGASAGGLKALKEFFATVRADTGIAFVVVVHLSPDHESRLASLLQAYCTIPVTQVTAETAIERNHVYVIPPNRNLSAVDSHLRLAPLDDARFGRAPVDHFFRTLAQTHDGSSIGVIMSGSGSDGAAGIRYIRESGGLALAQDPKEAEFDGMPRSAIAAGGVDRVLPIATMMPHILEFCRTQPQITGAAGNRSDFTASETTSESLQSILTLVRLRTGHDFLRYKRSTVARRIARRMQILNLEYLADYLDVVRTDAGEASTLLDDLLINVTSFFRDPEVFRILESDVIPSLFEGKERGEVVRVWSVGCATGEEAYTLAMLLLEEAGRRLNPPQVQVFATDLHEPSLQHGRDALFNEMIEAEISPERLERFFRRDSSGYRVTKELRDVVIFASHNLLRDPPFSRQDLIVCRNVLIYLQRDVQDEVIERFHYALRPGGRVLLGTAEILDRSDLFTVESQPAHLYLRREGHRGALRFPVAASSGHPRFPATDLPGAHRSMSGVGYSALHQKMLERHAPPSLLVSSEHVVIHLSDSVGRFMRLPGGEPTTNVFKLVREEFRLELRSALHSVSERPTPWRSRPIAVRIDGKDCLVTLRVSVATEPDLEGVSLVIFDELDPALLASDGAPKISDTHVLEVEAELDTTRARMQALIEEFETGQEEMRAANEELQSANEELRSTMEELETSREELQSVNEELQTLNQENRHKVEELSQLSSDLQNLLQATDIATIFLDRNLRILRYTPRVSDLFSIRHTDRGRPLADLTHRLGYNQLMDDVRRVLQTLVSSEHEVEGPAPGSWFVLRVAPYRTMDDRIEGVVITLIDISALKTTERALRHTQERHELLVQLQDVTRALSNPVQIQRAASRLLGEHFGANRAMYAEVEGDEVVVRGAYENGVGTLPTRFPSTPALPSPLVFYHRGEAVAVADVQTDHRFTDADRAAFRAAEIGALVNVMITKNGNWVATLAVQSVVPRAWSADDVALIRELGERTWDAVDHARATLALREAEERYRLTIEGTLNYAIFTVDTKGYIQSWSPGAAAVFGWTSAEAIGLCFDETFIPEDRAVGAPAAELALARAKGSAPDRRWHQGKDGRRIFIDGATHLLQDDASDERFVKVGQDVTQRREWEQSLKELNEALEGRVAERTDELSRANEARDALRLQLVQAEEQERARLARELHDEVGQHLTALALGLQALSDGSPPESEVSQRAEQLRIVVDTLSQEMHALAVRLRPKALDDFGLQAALAAYVDAWSQRSGIEADLHVADLERLSPAVESAVYRVVQEGLTNVAKHSRAMRASIFVERRDGDVVTIIEDDGRGFDAKAASEQRIPEGLGLLGIQERATLLGGSSQVESTVGGGTTVFVRIPTSLSNGAGHVRQDGPPGMPAHE